MERIKNSSLFLLWAGAAISISEIYTGGLTAPLGLAKGLAAILLGHLIGTLLLAFGGYISFQSGRTAMEKVRDSLGPVGVKIIASLNVLQLIGWGAVMIIQSGRAFGGIVNLPLSVSMILMGLAVLVWAFFFNNYSKTLNNIFVIILLLLSIMIFFKIDMQVFPGLKGQMNFATAVELSIAMPISWLPLIGDYTKNGQSKQGVFVASFFGYFIGSVLMYLLGLLITIHSGMDVIEYIVQSNMKFVAGFIIVIATVTTAFMDIYSAVISSKQIVPFKNENPWIIIYSLISLLIAFVFPIENFENFLLTIGSIFIPVYTIVFIEYLTHYKGQGTKLNTLGILVSILGTLLYNYLVKAQWGSPTIMVFILVSLIYLLIKWKLGDGSSAS
ncbi:putative hydroxymethylpyrimidine transporter CytX [Desulfitobacterium sp.]|uniref:putative hydroxymethylpyrimidine transporter CytX n=1 Tax=Desulfitobacterium sp. TaxID=49981 RepID=UPI002D150404|nr:putative hydroxymethylpyrimidine transporter CytX [Desulfitobacterium sp.]HVJ49681.1 putative hydroxymethylpyrimidine transporter CytX [Desulfitobacterium sp.]